MVFASDCKPYGLNNATFKPFFSPQELMFLHLALQGIACFMAASFQAGYVIMAKVSIPE